MYEDTMKEILEYLDKNAEELKVNKNALVEMVENTIEHKVKKILYESKGE